MVVFFLSGRAQHAKPKIDSRGALFAAVASSTMILAFSMAGTMYPWASIQVLGLLAVSIVVWVLFFKAEASAEEPIVDLQVLKNRTFITLASAGLLSSFGMAGLDDLLPSSDAGRSRSQCNVDGTDHDSRQCSDEFSRSSYRIHTRPHKALQMDVRSGLRVNAGDYGSRVIFFNAATPVWWGFIAFTLAGMSMGSIPTLNTLVAQYAVPRRLLGVVMGALYFSVMIGQSLAPAILGSAMNMKYTSTLKASLPAEVSQLADQATMTSLGNPRVLLSAPAMESLRETIHKDKRQRAGGF